MDMRNILARGLVLSLAVLESACTKPQGALPHPASEAPTKRFIPGEEEETTLQAESVEFEVVSVSRATLFPEPALNVVRAWEFADAAGLPEDWRFDGADVTLTEQGVSYVPQKKSGPGPVSYVLGIDAGAVCAVRVCLHAVCDGRSVSPQRLRFFWARTEDAKAAAGKWPFSPSRNVVFERVNGENDAWQARVDGHPDWNGAVERIFVEVMLPDECVSQDKAGKVIVSRIALLGRGNEPASRKGT